MTTLTLTNITLHAPNTPRPILTGVTYTVNQGDFVIILGGNGSGKSSLLKTINRTYQPTGGHITLGGLDISTIPAAPFARQLATVTQDASEGLFPGFTVLENARMYAGGKNLTSEFYARYLSEFSSDLAKKLDVPIEYLSGGQRQTLILALCLQNNPEIILLDEHTSALDPKTGELVMHKTYEAVRARGITCLMTTHDLGVALAYGDRLVALKDGGIVFTAEGAGKQALTRQDLLTYCY